MRFWKYHGLGNDFILIDGMYGPVCMDPEFAKKYCRRGHGIGADGVLYMLPGRDGADVSMRILNADGTEAEMCGNGIRCLAKHAFDTGVVRKKTFSVWTLAGIKEVSTTVGPAGKVRSVEVGMGKPACCGEKACEIGKCKGETIEVDGLKIKGYSISMGNPHFVTFQEFDEEAMKKLGPAIEGHKRFPNRTNVEFARFEDGGIRVKVYERGSGWTLACGTGACATAVAGILEGGVKTSEAIQIHLPGGKLRITVEEGFDGVDMDGPAELVYEARILD